MTTFFNRFFGVASLVFLITNASAQVATNNFLPGGIPPGAVRALPAAKPAEPSAGSLSKSNVAGLGVTRVIEKAIQPAEGGARADFGLQKTFFPVDVKDGGPVVITAPNGRPLSFRATFLALHDLSTDQSLLIAEVTNRVGAIVGKDEVIYTNAFDTLRADIRYRYTAQSLEQDIILHEHPTIPKQFSAENTRLEIWTEWFNSEPLSKSIQTIDLRAGEASGLLPATVINDEGLDFGTMKIVAGHAFSSSAQDERTPVGKSWLRAEGRDWLVETVDYLAVKSKLDLLPKSKGSGSHSQPTSKRETLIRGLAKKSEAPVYDGKEMMVAKADVSNLPQFVMDFVIVSSVPVPANAVSWWPAGGNTNDVLTNNHGTAYNGVTYAAGKVGQAFKFDGNNDHVRIPNHPNLRLTNAMTFEGWVYPTNVSYYREILSKWDAVWGYSQESFDCALYPGGQFYILVSPTGTDSGATFVLTSNSVPLNTWTHVAGTYDGSTLKVYLNGVLDGEGAYSNGIFPGTNSLGIGAATGGASPGGMLTPFPGMIDEPTLYARALGDAEILAIYNAGAAGKHNPQCIITAATNIVGWWPGDGHIYDLARTNFATLNAGATYGSARVGQGFSFDGADDYVEIPNAPDLNPTNAITLEAWVYQSSNQNQNVPIFSKDNPSSIRQYLLTVASNGKFRAHVWRNPGGIAYFDGITTVQLNTWYHVAMTYDRTNLTLYVNGVSDRSLPFSGDIVTSTDPLRIGGSYSGGWGNYKFAGLIDEPTVYGRALTSTEVTALYTAGSAGKCKVDSDSDGLSNVQEQFFGTDSNDSDSDDDGLTDGEEVFVHHTRPNDSDTDDDGLTDGQEVSITQSNPNSADSDGDDLPDGWEWNHFGNFSQTGGDDFDNDGENNLDEFLGEDDPATITFAAHFPTRYVNDPEIPVVIEPSGAVPHEMAVLINSSQWGNATWEPFQSSFALNLQQRLNNVCPDGQYVIRIGLRRSVNGNQYWNNGTKLILDRIPPILVITNPATSTVGQSSLQVEGYSEEPLASVAYDVISPTGSAPDRHGFVVDQYFDISLLSFTANYFACYDIPLASGENIIKVRATDLAGNVSSISTNIVLDSSTDTVPPDIKLIWPQNGMHVSGTTFYVRGMLDDGTARLTAELVTSAGSSQFAGSVERDGRFWVMNIPLSAGNNAVTLTATDGAGNAATKNFTVVKSDVELTIFAPSMVDRYQPVGVTGTVPPAEPPYSVTVNGSPAEVNESGYWTAFVTAKGRTSPSFDVSAVDPIGNTVNASSVVEARPWVAIVKHDASRSFNWIRQHDNTHFKQNDITMEYSAKWLPDADGEWKADYSLFWSEHDYDKFMDPLAYDWYATAKWSDEFPGGKWTLIHPNGAAAGDGPFYDDFPENRMHSSVPLRDDLYGDVEGPSGDRYHYVNHYFADLAEPYKRTRTGGPFDTYKGDLSVGATTQLKLFTGGKAGSKRNRLFSLVVLAFEFFEPRGDDQVSPEWTRYPFNYTPGDFISPSEIVALGKGFDNDGIMWVELPENTEVDATARVTSTAQHYNLELNVASWSPGIDLDVDSDNSGAIDFTEEEDEIEEATPGKYISVNNGDADGDAIPDFADGYDLFGTTDQPGQSAPFTQLAYSFPDGVDISKAKVKFTYSASDPATVSHSGGIYTPAPGGLRIWALDGGSFRKKAQIDRYRDVEYGGDCIQGS